MEAPTKKQEIAPTRAERKACWDSRDAFWACVDKNGEDSEKCKKFRENYENFCPAQWVKHFDRKYVYDQYKKRIENEGYEPIPATSSPSPSSSNNPKTFTDGKPKSAS